MTKRSIAISLLFLCSLCQAQVSSDIKSTANLENDSLLSRINRASSDSLKIDLYALLTGKTLATDPVSAEQFLHQSQLLVNRSADHDQAIRYKVLWLIFYNKTSQLSLAGNLIDQIKSEVTTVKRPKIRLSFLMEWAGYLNRSGRYGEAGEKYEEVRRLAHELKFFDIELAALSNFSGMLGAQKNIEKRKEILQKVLDLATENGLMGEVYGAKVNLAEAELLLHNYGKAEEQLKGCIEYFHSTNNLVGTATVYRHLGQVRLMSGKPMEALDFFQKALEIRTRQTDSAAISRIYIRKADAYRILQNPDSARWYIESALRIFHSLQLVEELKEATLLRADILAMRNEFPRAFQALKEHILLKDSSVTQIKPEKLNGQVERIRKEYTDSLTLARDARLNTSRRGNYVLSILLGLGLISGSILGVRWKQRLSSARAKEAESLRQLAATQAELSAVKRHLDEQVRFDLETLRARLTSEKAWQESYWNEFLLVFTRVYPDFFTRLKTDYPDLSLHELRICALMKMNLSSHDLTEIMSITYESVRKARYRIYKKIGLASDQELANFMLFY